MAFCKYCGKELEENQVCDCEKAVASRQMTTPNQDVTQQAKVASGVVKSAWGTFIGILKAPQTKGKEFVESGDNTNAYIILAAQAVMASIFTCVIIGMINKLVALGGSYLKAMEFSSFTAFVVTCLFSLIISAIMAVVTMVALKIVKVNIDVKKVVRIMAVRSVGIIPIMLLATILFALNTGFGILVFMLSSVLGFVFLGTILGSLEGLSGNKKTYLMFALIIVFLVVFSMIASKGVTLYIPETLKKYIGELSSLPDLMETIGEFM